MGSSVYTKFAKKNTRRKQEITKAIDSHQQKQKDYKYTNLGVVTHRRTCSGTCSWQQPCCDADVLLNFFP
jgi:hypothetical protein